MKDKFQPSPMGKPHSHDGLGVGKWRFVMRHRDDSTVDVFDRPNDYRCGEPRYLIRHTAPNGAHLGTTYANDAQTAYSVVDRVARTGRIMS